MSLGHLKILGWKKKLNHHLYAESEATPQQVEIITIKCDSISIFGELLLWGMRNVKVVRVSFPYDQCFLSHSQSLSLSLLVSK